MILHHLPALALALAIVAGAAGCASDARLSPGDIRPVPHSSGALELPRVKGLREAMAESPRAPVRVLAVHGMITSGADYSDALQTRLAERLQLQRGEQSDSVPLARGYDFVPAYGAQPFEGVASLLPSSLRRTAWTAPGPDGRPRERLVVYELLWAPLRDQIKQSFTACFERGDIGSSPACRPFSKALPNPDPRYAVNRAIKETITLGGFADATLVLGPIGDVIRDDLTLALCVMASDFLAPAGDALAAAAQARCNLAERARAHGDFTAAAQRMKDSRFLAMTHSLGSFLLMDAQQAYTAAEVGGGGGGDACAGASAGIACDEQRQSQLLFQMTDQATVFMNANQVSLLALARLSSAGCLPVQGSVCPNPYLRSRSGGNEPWSQPQGFPRMTVFVALNDTNDVLGFEVPPFFGNIDGYRFVNVSVRNPAFTLPGLFKNPSGAHTGQADNPAVIEAIVEGFALPK